MTKKRSPRASRALNDALLRLRPRRRLSESPNKRHAQQDPPRQRFRDPDDVALPEPEHVPGLPVRVARDIEMPVLKVAPLSESAPENVESIPRSALRDLLDDYEV